MRQCPANRFPLIDTGTLAFPGAPTSSLGATTASYQSAKGICDERQYFTRFNAAGGGLKLPPPPGISALPDSFTVSFWVYLADPNFNTTADVVLLNVFEQLLIVVPNNGAPRASFLFNATTALNVSSGASITTGKWTFIAVTRRTYYDTPGGLTQKFDVNIYQNTTSSAFSTANSAANSVAAPKTFASYIIVGGALDTNGGLAMGTSFGGYIQEIKLQKLVRDATYFSGAFTQLVYNYTDPTMLAYWRLNGRYAHLFQR
jgi:hypothetical protein